MSLQLRLRHPRGVTTINVDPEGTVASLQDLVFGNTEIPASHQELKTGYPPRSLTLIPELPVSSLGLNRGDQLIVTATAGSLGASASAPRTSGTTTTRRPAPATPNVESAPFLPKSEPKRELPSDDTVRIDGGELVHRVVPDDNSCLFSSIGIVFAQDMNVARQLRQVVAEAIKNDPTTYNEAVLGMPTDKYIATISKPSAWGGAIELLIFSDYYQTEIASFDIESGRCDRFGEGKYDNRAFLLYSGIHYDAVSFAPTPSAPVDFHQTVFPVTSDNILLGVQKMAEKLRAKKAFTNTATFDLKCEICGKGLKGEKEARKHASETGHASFGEY